MEALFGKKSPQLHEPKGEIGTVSSAHPDDLRKFHSKGFGAKNMRLIAVGGLPDDFDDMVKNYFGNKPTGEKTEYDFPLVKPLKKKVVIHSWAPDLKVKKNPMESNAYFNIGIILPPESDKYGYAVGMMNEMLGRGINSKLFRKIREGERLCHEIQSDYRGNYNRERDSQDV